MHLIFFTIFLLTAKVFARNDFLFVTDIFFIQATLITQLLFSTGWQWVEHTGNEA